jgi:hypothetical protein
MTLQVPEPTPLQVADDPAPLRPPPESELVEAGRLTMGQLAQAHRDRLETGKHVLDIIVERGWVSADEVAELRKAYGIQAPPSPTVAPVPEPVAPPPAATCVSVAIRLTNGDLITAGEADDSDKASALALAVVADLTNGTGEWPFFGGRYINPETIVSVDLVAQEQS